MRLLRIRLNWGLCPQTPRIYRIGAKMALKIILRKSEQARASFQMENPTCRSCE